jgi:hypothetical protein
MRTEQVETITGRGRLRLSDRYASVNYVIRVFQDFVGDAPTIKHASGDLDLPHGDVARAMMDRKPVELELQDGRKANLLFTQLGGDFTVTGPIA